MKVRLSIKEQKKVANQRPTDIIKKSYQYEKKMEKEWKDRLLRIGREMND